MRACVAIAFLCSVACGTSELDLDVAAATTTTMIEDALTCGRLGLTGVPATGNDLQRYDLSTAYPDAVCNDGSSAILYFRPGVGLGRNSWLIELEGGGGCRTPQECADRYCAVDPTNPAATTPFGIQQMSSDPYPPRGIVGTGIQSETDLRNPYRLYNHVLIHYCSSDGWTGQSPLAIGTGVDPVARTTPVTFGARFNGDAILFDALRVLRRDGATLPAFTLDTLPQQWIIMPDLDAATGKVVIAGGSAGGVGVTFQLDRIVASLAGSANYVGFIDSTFSPDLAPLFFQLTGFGTYQGYIEGTAPYYATRTDDSCSSMHSTDAFRCDDVTHVLRNHVTTPFFIRQGETDWLLSGMYTTEGFATSATATMPMVTSDFKAQVRQQGNLIPSWATIAEEPPPTPVGAFIPGCAKHDPLHDAAAMFETLIGTTPWQDTWGQWIAGTPPFVVVENATSTCR
jgi:pectinacetylesterase